MPVKCVLQGGEYVVRDDKGKVHGRHGKDKSKCQRQARAINMTVENAGELKLFGVIGSDIRAEDFIDKLDNMEGEVTVRINSPGGSVPEGFAIFHAISQRKEKTTARIEGSAWSMAGVLLAAFDRVEMSAVGLAMLHDIQFSVSGDLATVESRIEAAKKSRDLVYGQLGKRLKKTNDEIVNMLTGKELWLKADEALELGLVDSIIELPENVALCVSNSVDIPKEYQGLLLEKEEDEMSLLDLANELGLECQEEDKAKETIISAFKSFSEKKEEPKEINIPKAFLEMARRDRITRIENLVSEYRISKAVGDDLKVQYCSDTALKNALTEEGEVVDSFENIISALAKNEKRIDDGEVTPAQKLDAENNPLLKVVKNRAASMSIK